METKGREESSLRNSRVKGLSTMTHAAKTLTGFTSCLHLSESSYPHHGSRPSLTRQNQQANPRIFHASQHLFRFPNKAELSPHLTR